MGAPLWALQFVRFEYADRGRGPQTFDCWGFVRLVEQTMFGINLPDLADAYSSCEDHDSVAEVVSRTREALGRHWYPVLDASPGDIVILNIGGRPWHCGVVTAGDWMLHMQKGVNVGLERFTREPWRNRVEGIYHYAG